MRRLTLRLQDATMDALQTWASHNRVPIAEAARLIVAQRLKDLRTEQDCRVFHIPASSHDLPGHVRVPVGVPLALVCQAEKTLLEGNGITAIRDLRAATGLGLYEAKVIVMDILRAEIRTRAAGE